ncbi:MAG: hypothetical protein DRP78_04405 [Candidatus Omnitrophota bacterium]|nr:MAG: hypothetical protein DRP78_04405 [Candidatus Omnitrophota bacterium]
MKKKVVVLLISPLEIDSRMCNELKTLITAGYDVIVYAWDRERAFSDKAYGKVEGIPVNRVLVKSAYGRGVGQLFNYFCFWVIVFFRLLKINFDIVHCVDLNTLLPGVIAAKLKRKKILYDAHEDFPALMLDLKVRPLVPLAAKAESILIKMVDSVITVSNPISDVLKKRGAREITVVRTTKLLAEYDYTQDQVFSLRKKLGVQDKFVFFYIGLLSHNRKLIEIANIFTQDQNNDIVFVVGGYGILEEELKKAAQECAKIVYIGRIAGNEVPLYTKASNVILAVNTKKSKNSNTTLPNKLFEAIAAGRPIIGSSLGPMGRIIRETECGLTVDDPDNAENIKKAIFTIISDKAIYAKLCCNAVAAQQTYAWEKTAKTLLRVYKNLET